MKSQSNMLTTFTIFVGFPQRHKPLPTNSNNNAISFTHPFYSVTIYKSTDYNRHFLVSVSVFIANTNNNDDKM